MWKRKARLFITALLSLLCFLSLPCVGTFSRAEAAETDTMTISKTDWEKLRLNNELQAKALRESQAELNAVKQAQEESEKALNEARSLLESSQMTSDEMTSLCATLLNELNLQKAENEKLTQELKNAKAESLTAYESMMKANQYLADTKKEIEANEAAWRKRENQLERQRLEWQIASVLFGYIGYEIGRH
jgi:predicted proteasome-type protease